MGADLSVIIVNYRAGALLSGAIASVLAQEFSRHGRPGRVETIIVDNASGPEDEPFLEALRPGTYLIKNERNLGFGAACNQGVNASSGEFLCFLNPDARLLPGALESLLRSLLSRPGVGAVGPAFWADDEQLVRLPPNEPPTLADMVIHRLAGAFPPLARFLTLRWSQQALAFWKATAPLQVSMLSGACLVTSRATFERVGPFDPDFFLYFEDADWCRRARAKGFRLLHVPGAQVVHYYNQSAKIVAREAFEWARASEARYVAKHFGPVRRWLLAAADRVARARAAQSACPVRAIDLGSLSDPPLLSLSAAEPVVFQLAHHWLFVPAAAAFPSTSAFQVPSSVWARLLPTRYFARAVSLRSGLPIETWTWIKQP